MRIIDLSMPLYTGMEVFPGDPKVKIEVVHTYESKTWELRNLQLGSHTGTHVDAFSHMIQGEESIDKIPLENFMGKAQLVNINEAWPKNLGLLFAQKIGIQELETILEANPRFVGGNLTEELERELLKEKIITYTGLVHLDLLPRGRQFMFYGFPLKIRDGDGSPVRAVAVLEE